MADVRLTATNPADSSVVPVACNEKGELKLEEIPDQSFDGNLEGDLTVTGGANFAGRVWNYTTLANQTGNGFSLVTTDSGANPARNFGFIRTSNVGCVVGTDANNGMKLTGNLGNLGVDAEFTGNVKSGGNSTQGRFAGTQLTPGGMVISTRPGSDPVFAGYQTLNNGNATNATSTINADGSVAFSGNKAGFTAEGHLWCTTRRGDTVILDATSNGLASWAPYTPPNRFTELQDKWAEKDGILPVPHESSQDEPETPQ